jgi:L-cysteine:1D-myo-inositol 2-amino-2-deoxy-alpha-D-glucopyranoside ligase
MRAWSEIAVPRLPGIGRTPILHDTATGQQAVFGAQGRTGLYVCGITPYDATHLGHAATGLAFDLVVRAVRDADQSVRYVQNVTDVDDPLLVRATETGEDWVALAERETELYRTDMSALRMVSPDAYVGAVESIPLILELIEELQARGAVYEVDGDRYFSAAADSSLGSVSRLDRREMPAKFGENGGDPGRPGKRDPLDSLLWLRARPGEPSWDSPWGAGRPGWHVECAAIALHHLDAGLGVQGGGRDLAFPHHEMTASVAQVARGTAFADAYVHTGMVGLGGEKMSKSRGNLVRVSALLTAGEDPMALRLALLDRHYRGDWDWTDAALVAARERLQRWRLAARRGHGEPVSDDPSWAAGVRAEVRDRLADDLDTEGAVRAVDAWAAHVLAADVSPAEARAVSHLCDALLGVDL